MPIRTKYFYSSFVGLLIALAAIAVNPFYNVIAMFLWAGGLAWLVICLGRLQVLIGKDNMDPAFADEYQRSRIDRARSNVFKYAYFALGSLMVLMLCLPLLDLVGQDVPWPEIVRCLGMLAGVLMFGASLTLLGTIALGMDADDRAELADS